MGCLLIGWSVQAEDYTGSSFILRDPFLTLIGGYASSSAFTVYSQTGSQIESGLGTGSSFVGRLGTESYPYFTSPVITATAGDAQVAISWTASQVYFGGTVSSYSVGRSSIAGGPYTYTSVGSSLSSTVTGLTNSTTYYFVVRVSDTNLTQYTYSAEVSSTPVAVSSGGGGGGGGGGGAATSNTSDTVVNFIGRAFPKSSVSLLQDGELVVETVAGPSSIFEISLTDLSEGTYNFTLYGEDQDGRRSASQSFQITVTNGATTTVSGIYISPTIAVDKSQVKQGDNLAIFGQTVPTSTVTIVVNSDTQLFAQTYADGDGVYLYNLDTTPLNMGDHETKAKSLYKTEISDFGAAATFAVTNQNVLVGEDNLLRADISGDKRVNLLDFAIVGYWYKRTLSPEFAVYEATYLNGDGKIDLIDFAIMAFYWTG